MFQLDSSKEFPPPKHMQKHVQYFQHLKAQEKKKRALYVAKAKDRIKELNEMDRDDRMATLCAGEHGVDKAEALELISGAPKALLKHVTEIIQKEEEARAISRASSHTHGMCLLLHT